MPDGLAKRPRNATHRPRLTSPSPRARGRRRSRYTLVLLLVLTATLLVGAAPTRAVSAAVPETSHDEASSKAVTPVVAQDVILRYTFRPSSMALLVHDSGELAAHDLLSGVPLWSLDTGGPVMKAEMLQPPSRETMSYDPLSTPLLVHGNQLFMRAPYDITRPAAAATTTAVRTRASAGTLYSTGPNITMSGDEFDHAGDNAPGTAAPTLLYFMNVSTLLRRQSVVVADTDIYTTTSVSIMDVDATSGRVLRTMAPGMPAGTSFAQGEHASQSPAAATSLPDFMPVLHVVRYNIFIHAYKPNGYHWRITLSQLRLLGKEGSLHGDSGASPAHKRFFSQMAKDMFGFDDVHCARRHARGGPAKSSHAAVPHTPQRDTQAAGELLYSAHDYAALTHTADVRRAFVLYEDNSTHIALHDITRAADLWHRPWATRQNSLAGHPPASRVAFAYVWLNRTTHIARIPVWRTADASYDYTVPYLPALTRLAQEDTSRATSAAALPPDGTTSSSDASTRRGARMMPPRWAVARHSAQGGGALIPFSYSSWRSDIAADEDEGEELQSYYLEHLVELNDPLTRWLFSEGGQSTQTRLDTLYQQSPRGRGDEGRDNGGVYRGAARLRVLPALSWKLVAIVLTHLVLLAGSIGLLCAGVPPRARLQRAWAEVDHNRDVRLRVTASRPPSSKLRPHDPNAPSSFSSRAHTSVATVATMGVLSDSASFQLPAALLLPTMATTTTPSKTTEESTQDEQRQVNGAAAATKQTGSTSPAASMSEAANSSESNSTTDSWQPAQHTTNNDQLDFATAQPARDNDDDKDDDDDDARMGEYWWRHTTATTTTTTTTTTTGTSNTTRHNKTATTTTLDGDHDGTTQHSLTDNDVTSEQETSMAASQRGGFSQAKLFQQHFNVLRKIGFGGEGSVFCVEHRVTRARYAIKVVRLHDRDDDKEVREAILHSSFDHPNVVRFYFCWIETVPAAVAARLQLLDLDDGMDCPSCSTYRADSSAEVSVTGDAGTEEGVVRRASHVSTDLVANYRMLFIQMEYFANGTLADLLRNRAGFTNCTNLGYLKSIAEGLAYLHSMDVVHRDLKPTNIFVGKGGVLKIGDFGLAKQRHHNSNNNNNNNTYTTSNSTPGETSYAATEMPSVYGEDEHSVGAGSPLYCSPEQKRGEAVGRPSDIYSLGLLGVEMYCEFTTLHERIRCLTNCRQGIFPEALRSDYPDECRLFARMLADEPARRPTARALVRSFRRLLEQCASAQDAASTTSALSDADEAERRMMLAEEDEQAKGAASDGHEDGVSTAELHAHAALSSPSAAQESDAAMQHNARHAAAISEAATPPPTVVRVPVSGATACDDDAVRGVAAALQDGASDTAAHDVGDAGERQMAACTGAAVRSDAPLPCPVKGGEAQVCNTCLDAASSGLSTREQSAANTFAVSGMLSLTSFATRRPSL